MKKLLLSILFCGLLVSPTFALVPFTKSALTSTAVLVGAPSTPPTILYYNISNTNSSVIYVQFFNAATAGAVTVGTTAPTFWVAVPAFGVVDSPITNGIQFSLGVVIATTTTPTGSGNPTNSVPVTIFYR